MKSEYIFFSNATRMLIKVDNTLGHKMSQNGKGLRSQSVCFFLNYLFIYLLFLAVLGLHFCARAFSSCGKWGPLFIAVHGTLTIVASLVAEHRVQTRAGSVIVAHEPSCSTACGIFPDQGSNPCPLHWQADSQPLPHQGSPQSVVFDHSEINLKISNIRVF